MTDNELRTLALEYGLTWDADDVVRFARKVEAAEREACAKLCDWLNGEPRLTPAGCAAAILARGTK